MDVALKLLATAMLLSFLFGLAAMVYDVTSKRGLSDRATKAVTVIYLWPVAIVGGCALALALSLIWGFHT